jgi:hypothetical protein
MAITIYNIIVSTVIIQILSNIKAKIQNKQV